jgi:prevent-host-death family protein
MAETVNMHHAKTQFSKLIERVQRGEEIVVAKAGKPVARIVPLARPRRPRVPGRGRGTFTISDDFDAPLPAEILDAIEE